MAKTVLTIFENLQDIVYTALAAVFIKWVIIVLSEILTIHHDN